MALKIELRFTGTEIPNSHSTIAGGRCRPERLSFLHRRARKGVVLYNVRHSVVLLAGRAYLVMPLQGAKTGGVWIAKIPMFQCAVEACGDKTFALKDETRAIDGSSVRVPLCCDGTFTL